MNGYISSKSEKNLSVIVTLNNHTHYFIGATEVSWSLEREAESQFLTLPLCSADGILVVCSRGKSGC